MSLSLEFTIKNMPAGKKALERIKEFDKICIKQFNLGLGISTSKNLKEASGALSFPAGTPQEDVVWRAPEHLRKFLKSISKEFNLTIEITDEFEDEISYEIKNGDDSGRYYEANRPSDNFFDKQLIKWVSYFMIFLLIFTVGWILLVAGTTANWKLIYILIGMLIAIYFVDKLPRRFVEAS